VASLDFNVRAVVNSTSTPVVAAIVLWIYSIRNSFDGTIPLGHNGQSGQLSPTPLELTYPPKKINEKRTARVVKERYFKNIA